jgi:formylglycine-generating enzyme required for sulfatase activity
MTFTPTDTANYNTVTDDVNIRVLLGVEMVHVSGGSFEMGKNLGSGGGSDVTPVHTVTVSGFYMGKYQVTQEQYQTVMGSNPSIFLSNPTEGETQNRRPVEGVSWYDALMFCNKLSIAEGLTPAYSRVVNGTATTDPSAWGTVPTSSNAAWNAVTIVSGSTGYRLPTEAQWEYAAKGGDPTAEGWVGYTYAGSDTVGSVAWWGDTSGNSESKTHEVGKLAANGLGLYDMSGNVNERCWDWFGSYASGSQTDPMGASSGTDRVIRGGSWSLSAVNVRSAYRNGGLPYSRSNGGGFRLARPVQ